MERLHVSTNIEAKPVMRALHVALTGRVFRRGCGWGQLSTEWSYPYTERTLFAQMERDHHICVALKSDGAEYEVDRGDIEEGLGELLREYPDRLASIMRGAVKRWVDNPGYFKACTMLLELTVWGHTMSEDMAEGE
jgi:hypothetical protein